MKLMKVLVAVLVLAGIALPAVAEDKLSISGEFYVMGYMQDNYRDFDSDILRGALGGNEDADKVSYFKQRLRLYSKYAVTEGVSIHTRMDFGEEAWGNEGQNSIRFDETDTEFQLDRAFVEIVKGPWNLRAGQQYYGFGNSFAVDHQGTGFQLSYAGPVKVTAFWNKLDENGLSDDSTIGSEDIDMYGASVKYKNDAFAAELFYAKQEGMFANNALFAGIPFWGLGLAYDVDGDKSVIGLAASSKLGAVNLGGEVNIFDGEQDGDDYEGFQVYLDANTALTDAFTLGGKLFWAKGYDDKIQLSELSDFGSVNPEEYGYLETDFGLLAAGGSVFNPLNANAGTESLMLYGKYKVSDTLGLMFSAQYGQEQDDDFVDYDYTSFNLSAQYTIAKNTFFQVQGNYLNVDCDLYGFDTEVDKASGIAAKLLAKF